MVRSTEGTAERSTGLTIGHKRVGEEQAGLSRKAIGNLTGLTHKTILHLHGVVDRTTITDDRILTDDTRTNEYWGIHRTHHRTLTQTGCTRDLTVALDDGIRNVLCIDDLHIIADIATIRTRHTQLILDHLLHGVLQLLVGVVFHHESSQLTVQLPENSHITIAHLVEHGDHRTFTVGSIICGLQRADI